MDPQALGILPDFYLFTYFYLLIFRRKKSAKIKLVKRFGERYNKKALIGIGNRTILFSLSLLRVRRKPVS